MSTLKYRIRTFFKYWDLIVELVKRDIKLKYRRSFLGYIWSILNPLLIMIVMTVVFSSMFRKSIENYPIYLLTGRTLFEFMKGSTTSGMKSVTHNAALLKKTYIPKYIFTLAKSLSILTDTVFTLGAFFIVMIATRTAFHLPLLYLPVILIQVFIFSLGISFLLAQMMVFFRDIEYIYNAVLTAWTYLTPMFYPIDRLPNLLQILVRTVNPMYGYVTQFRSIALYGQMPSGRLMLAGWIWAIVMLIIGLYMFQKNKDKFILYI